MNGSEKKKILKVVLVFVAYLVLGLAYVMTFVPGDGDYKTGMELTRPWSALAGSAVFICMLIAGLYAVNRLICARYRKEEVPRFKIPGVFDYQFWIFLGIIMIYTFSGLASDCHAFMFPFWNVGFSDLKHLILSPRFCFVFATCLAAPIFILPNQENRSRKLWRTVLIFGELLCASSFLMHNRFSATWTDDNPSFLFRISEFMSSFPWMENYVPFWNAGVVNSVIVSSGTIGYAFFGLPLWLIMPEHVAAPYVYIFVFIVAIPWLTVGAFRCAKSDDTTSMLGGIFSLCMNSVFLLWAIHFGTVGAAISWASAPVACLFLYAVIVRRQFSLPAIFGLIFSMFMTAQWPPMLILGIPFALYSIVNVCDWWHGRAKYIVILTGTIILGLIFPIVYGAFMSKTVLSHTMSETVSAPEWLDFLRFIKEKIVAELFAGMNPVVAASGICGLLFLFKNRCIRSVAIPLIMLLIYALYGEMFYPNLQAGRMVVPVMCLISVPAAVYCAQQLTSNGIHPAAKSVIAGLVICGIFNVAYIYHGVPQIPYGPVTEKTSNVFDWIKENVPDDARLLFAGNVVHSLGKGHIAYLPKLCNREMMSCDYYGFPVGMIEYDYPPRQFRTSLSLMHSFMAKHAVSHVVTCRKKYIDLFRSAPEYFTEVATILSDFDVNFVFFEVNLSGSIIEPSDAGRVRADFNRIDIDLQPEYSDRDVIIAYNWDNRLSVSGSAEIFPVDKGDGIEFVGIRPNGDKEIHIRYNSDY